MLTYRHSDSGIIYVDDPTKVVADLTKSKAFPLTNFTILTLFVTDMTVVVAVQVVAVSACRRFVFRRFDLLSF